MKCYVWKIKENKLIKLGKLYKNDESFLFEPNKNLDIQELSKLIFLNGSENDYASIKNAIRDASPDAWGRSLIQHITKRGYEDINELEYLLFSNEDKIGDLIFTKDNSIKEALEILNRNNTAIDFNCIDFIHFINQPNKNDLKEKELIGTILHGTSVGGARPKALVNYEDGKYLAKFNSNSDVYDVIKSEFVGMQLAEKIGLNVAKTKLIKVENKTVLLVERFDRVKNEKYDEIESRKFFENILSLEDSSSIFEIDLPENSLNFYRKNMVSALTVMEEDESYYAYTSYPEFFSKIPQKHNVEIFKRIVFNVLIGNNDDHARNHACFFDNGLELTPAYDLCPMPRKGSEVNQAMFIGLQNKEAKLSNCIDASYLYNIKKEDAVEIIRAMIKDVQNGLVELYQQESLQEVIESLYLTSIFNPSIFYHDEYDLENLVDFDLLKPKINPSLMPR